jgi:biopolymer transport protein ExbD
MKGMFHRKERQVPGLTTTSLPDLIFTVLFFFMIVTHMRDVEPLVRYMVPQGKELQKQEHKGSVATIYIGRLQKNVNRQLPSEQADASTNGNEFYIQLNNKIASIDDIKDFIEKERAKMNEEDRSRMTVSIKADRDVPMGMIDDIKQVLRQSFALKINYSAAEQ